MGWYGGGPRRVEVATGPGHWHKSGRGLAPVRRAFARDLAGTHRDEFVFTTGPALTPAAAIGLYCGRWSIAAAFQERRSGLGPGATRGWREGTVRRAAPCLFGLYSAAASPYQALPESKRSGSAPRPGKSGAASSDARCAVRRRLWAEAVFPRAGGGPAVQNLPEPPRELRLTALAPAA